MSLKLENPFPKLVHAAEDKAKDVANGVKHAVGQAENKVQGAIQAVKNNETVQEVKNFVGATADSFERAVGLKEKGNEPAILSGQQGTWTPSKGALYVEGPTTGDVQQGAAGDCYFLSSVASLAQNHPDAIKNAIKDNGNGTYTVTFHVPEGFGALKALGPTGGLLEGTVLGAAKKIGLNLPEKTVQVTVDDKQPTDANGNPLYVHSGDANEKWVGVMEKAYAQLWGSYGAIGNGGDPGTAMRALTGGDVQHHVLGSPLAGVGVKVGEVNVTPEKANAVFQDLKAATESQKMVVASTYNVSTGKTLDGVVSGHCYSVLGTSEENGQKYVTLRNPWGHHEPGSDGNDDGIFKLPVEQFIQSYASYDVGSVK